MGSISGWGTEIPQAACCLFLSHTYYNSKLNGHVWLVVTVLDRDDRILASVQKILLDSTGINNVEEDI